MNINEIVAVTLGTDALANGYELDYIWPWSGHDNGHCHIHR